MILDFVRESFNGDIIIPNFHTGHLGFVPGTEVSVSLHEPFNNKTRRHCELLVTPFEPNFSTLCYLTCTMKDQPGVVNKLIDAISSLEINIVKHESSSINSLNHHLVELVLDWKTSPYRGINGPTSIDVYRRFNHIAHLLPIGLERYYILYRSIMSHCGDLINFNNVYGQKLPSLKIIPFVENTVSFDERRVVIDRKKNKKNDTMNAFIRIHEKHISKIRHMCDTPAGEALHYIINSEANTRSLRIFFLSPESVKKIFHVSFSHNDEPGALSAITSAIADSNFNILTGLLRKKDSSESRYETILEYHGSDKKIPEITASKDDRVLWVHEKILNTKKEIFRKLQNHSVQISQPVYPNKGGNILDLVSVNHEANGILNEALDDENTRFEKMISRISDFNSEFYKERIGLLDDLRKYANRKPTVFLSFAHYASEHARILTDNIHLNFPGKYEIAKYQDPDFEDILNKSMAEINNCDYFIGIWHHEFRNVKDEYSISPWMSFEYGIAKSLQKKIIVIRSDKLPEEVWKRIDPGISKPSFTDLNFKDVISKTVIPYMRERW